MGGRHGGRVPRHRDRGPHPVRPAYLGGALLAAGALTIGLLAPGFITGGTYLVLGAIHAVPMWLDATQ